MEHRDPSTDGKDRPPGAKWVYRISLAAAGAVLFTAVAVHPSFWSLAIGLGVALASGAFWFGASNAYRRWTGRLAVGLPGLGTVLSAQVQWKVLLAASLLIFGLREGVVPSIPVNLNTYTASWTSNRTVQSSGNVQRIGTERGIDLSRWRLACSLISCSGGAALCRNFEQRVSCTPRSEFSEGERAAALDVSLSVSGGGFPACAVPFRKSAHFDGSLTGGISAHWSSEKSSRTESITRNVQFTGSIQLQQTVSGPISCRNFERLAGAKFANQVDKLVRDVVE